MYLCKVTHFFRPFHLLHMRFYKRPMHIVSFDESHRYTHRPLRDLPFLYSTFSLHSTDIFFLSTTSLSLETLSFNRNAVEHFYNYGNAFPMNANFLPILKASEAANDIKKLQLNCSTMKPQISGRNEESKKKKKNIRMQKV